ncbi:hypothetical protein PCL_08206 [Purpureocillium lilacinum]|uniref:Uncharacterized protein n=1 Tax=Purpureocillium lilacinum TaxID=33203 RepID=A0A2U3EK84_PURLI|nr:hypothetical protein PCL_08206 [Purpureocillium lilacinum]
MPRRVARVASTSHQSVNRNTTEPRQRTTGRGCARARCPPCELPATAEVGVGSRWWDAERSAAQRSAAQQQHPTTLLADA